MESYVPVVALAGIARLQIMTTEEREKAARTACFKIGQELAKAGWRIAVYGEDYSISMRELIPVATGVLL